MQKKSITVMNWKNCWLHFKNTCKHKWWVFYYSWFFGIPWRGFMHDWSKFSPTEFIESVKFFKGDSSPTVGGVVANAGTVRFDVGPALGDMTISNGATASFTAAPTLSGTLTIASTDADFRVDGLAETAAWGLLATAADIVGPNNEEKWKTANGMRRFKIVAEGTGKSLYGAKASGFTMIVR